MSNGNVHEVRTVQLSLFYEVSWEKSPYPRHRDHRDRPIHIAQQIFYNVWINFTPLSSCPSSLVLSHHTCCVQRGLLANALSVSSIMISLIDRDRVP